MCAILCHSASSIMMPHAVILNAIRCHSEYTLCHSERYTLSFWTQWRISRSPWRWTVVQALRSFVTLRMTERARDCHEPNGSRNDGVECHSKRYTLSCWAKSKHLLKADQRQPALIAHSQRGDCHGLFQASQWRWIVCSLRGDPSLHSGWHRTNHGKEMLRLRSAWHC